MWKRNDAQHINKSKVLENHKPYIIAQKLEP